MNSFSTRIFLRRVLPYFAVCAAIIIVLLIFKWNGLGIFGGDFVASLRLPGALPGAQNGVKLSGAALSEKLFEGEKGLSAFQHLVYSKGYSVITQILGAVAVLAMVYHGIKMIVSNSNEERVKEARHAILMIFMGLAIVAIADVVVKEVFVLSGGTFMGDNTVTVDGKSLTQLQKSTARFNEQIHIIITFFRYITQGIAFFFIIRSGLALIVGGQQSDVLDTQKKVFMWGIVGLVFIMTADTVIKKVIFPVEYGKELVVGKVQVETGISLIAQVINMLLAFAGGVAVFSLIAGATMYVSAIGHEQSTEKGKKIVVGSLMGLVIIFSAYTIVAEFIR